MGEGGVGGDDEEVIVRESVFLERNFGPERDQKAKAGGFEREKVLIRYITFGTTGKIP